MSVFVGSAADFAGLAVTGSQEAAYVAKVLALSPIAYWVLGEHTGAVAYDQIDPPDQNGTHVGVTLGNAGIGDGQVCPYYDGANDYTNVYSAALNAAFNGPEGTLVGWLKVANVGVWTDGNPHRVAYLRGDANNDLSILKAGANNRLQVIYRTGATNEVVNADGYVTTDWLHLGCTFSDSNNSAEVAIFVSGAQVGAAVAVANPWGAASLNSSQTLIGAWNQTGTNVWLGYLAHVAIWDSVLTAPQMATLATV